MLLTSNEPYNFEDTRFLDPKALSFSRPSPPPHQLPKAIIFPLIHLRNKPVLQMTHVDFHFAFIH